MTSPEGAGPAGGGPEGSGPAGGGPQGVGYRAVGAPFQEAGIAHVRMERELVPGLRPVADEDGAGLVRLIGGCWAEYPGCVLDVPGEEPWLLAPATAYAGTGGGFWVVPGTSGAIRACVGWRPAAAVAERPAGVAPGVAPAAVAAGVAPGAAVAGVAPAAELKSLYVAADDRRQGWGRVLVRLVERAAAESGHRKVVLWSDTRFEAAHAFYTRLGYRRTGAQRELHDLSGTREYEFVRALGDRA